MKQTIKLLLTISAYFSGLFSVSFLLLYILSEEARIAIFIAGAITICVFILVSILVLWTVISGSIENAEFERKLEERNRETDRPDSAINNYSK